MGGVPVAGMPYGMYWARAVFGGPQACGSLPSVSPASMLLVPVHYPTLETSRHHVVNHSPGSTAFTPGWAKCLLGVLLPAGCSPDPVHWHHHHPDPSREHGRVSAR